MFNTDTEGVNLILLIILGLNSDTCSQNNLVYYINHNNTLERPSVKFVVKNYSEYAVSARLKISLDGINYSFDGGEVIIDPGVIKTLKPKLFTRYTRLAYKYINPSQSSSLDNVVYLPQM